MARSDCERMAEANRSRDQIASGRWKREDGKRKAEVDGERMVEAIRWRTGGESEQLTRSRRQIFSEG